VKGADMERDAIIRKIINRAVSLFDEGGMDGDGLFTTAHYGQAMKTEFDTPAALDYDICAKHLLEMGALVESVEPDLWKRIGDGDTVIPTAKQMRDHANRRATHVLAFESDMFDPHGVRLTMADDGTPHESSLREAQGKGLKLLADDPGRKWTADDLVDAIEPIWASLPNERDNLLHDLVGCVLYAMAVEGRVVTDQVLLTSKFVTVFAIAPGDRASD